jgi:hypothetical protein
MRPGPLALAVLAPILFVLACAEPTVTEPAQPSLGFGNGPAIPGSSGVVRFGDQLIIRLDYVTDQGERLVRHYPADDSFEICGGSQSAPVVAEQFVTDPNFINGVVVVLRRSGEIPVLIYPPDDGSKPLCDYLRDDWLFRGTGRLVYNDNNILFDPSRTNAFGWSGAGTVYDRSGNRYRYTEDQLIVVDPEPFNEHVVRARLELIPVH